MTALVDLAIRTLLRVADSNLFRVRPSDAERVRLEREAGTGVAPLIAGYLVWRKASLLMACLALTTLVVFEVATWTSFAHEVASAIVSRDPLSARLDPVQLAREVADELPHVEARFGKRNLRLIDAFNMAVVGASAVGAACAAIALVRWPALRASRRWTRGAWAVTFITPFLISLVPVRWLIDWASVDPAARAVLEPALGPMAAAMFVLIVGPKVLSLFPAFLRASMTLKTMLPEAAVLGWAVVLAAPLYAAVLLVTVSLALQVEASRYLLYAALCLLGSPMIYLLNAPALIRPELIERGSRVVSRVRKTSVVFNLAGVTLLVLFFLDYAPLGWDAALRFVLALVGSVLTMKVVAADLVLSILTLEHGRDDDDPRERGLSSALEVKLRVFEEFDRPKLRNG